MRGEVLDVRGTEMRRMDEGEKEAVDGNEAEACYVVSVRILWACSKRFDVMWLDVRETR